MAGKECYHCKLWIEAKDAKTHNCWSTTEEKLTENLNENLLDAWLRLRETACNFGEQRIYASHKSIMFSRKSCHFFVRPKPKVLEICFFLSKPIKHLLIRKTSPVSKTKVAHVIHVSHRDEVETPLTDWLREAYLYSAAPRAMAKKTSKTKAKKPIVRTKLAKKQKGKLKIKKPARR